MNELLRRLHYLFNRRRLDEELASDLEVHREMAALAGGLPVGNTLHLREESRDAWGWTWIERFFQDLRYASRVLRKSPGFTLMAVLTLAVGAGVNIAAFSFFDFMVLRPLNVRQPDTIFRFHRRSPQAYSFVLPYPEMDFLRQYNTTLSSVLALNPGSLTVEGEERRSKTHFVSANWFTDLGASVHLGRLIDPNRDEAPGADPVVVLGYAFWQRRFGSDPSIVGRALRFKGKPATVIGVASPEFTGLSLEQPDLWVPITQYPYFTEGSRLLTDFSTESSGVEMWGRIRPGVAPGAMEAELQSLAAELRRQHPKDIWEKESIPGEPSGRAENLLTGGRRGTGTEQRDNIYPVVAMSGGLAILILAVACGNLGSLLLARGVSRDREISIRVAVGAGRGRLVRQLLTESLLLGLLGSAAGLLLGRLLLRVLMNYAGSPAWLDPTPDWRIIVFAIGLGFVSALLFGLTPALQIVRQRHRATALRHVLIGAQVAASCVLLIVAALVVRALDHAMSAHAGFEYRNVVAITPQLGGHGYSPSAARNYLTTAVDRLGHLPGVESVSLATSPPFGNVTSTGGFDIDGRALSAALNNVDPPFFRTMEIPLLAGRNLLPGETGVAVVSQSFARRYWPGEDPLGKQIPMGSDPGGASVKYTVVGVCANARMIKLEDPDLTEVYFPLTPENLTGVAILVKTATAPKGLVPAMASIVNEIDPKLAPSLETLPVARSRKLQGVEYGALAVSVLGCTALALACLGIVGVVAYAVSQRKKEIGIRLALGARPGNVIGVILRQFTIPVAGGLLLGVVGAVALSSLLRQALYGVSGVDPIAYLGAVTLFVVTVTLAACVPARRALRVDPVHSLRSD